jgi:hypothetical protein
MDRKALIRRYKETRQPAGVYRVRNRRTERALVGCAANLEGILNRHRFQLERGSHPSRGLQADWNALGPDAFEFEVLDQLKPAEKPDADESEDLRVLKELWIERLASSGVAFYPEAG